MLRFLAGLSCLVLLANDAAAQQRADNAPGGKKLALGWTMDLSKMKPSDDPVTGKILGAEFKVEKAELQNTGLELKSGKDRIHIFLNLKPGEGIAGKTFKIDARKQQRGFPPAVHIHVHSIQPIRAAVHQNRYAMRLEFGKDMNGTIPAKIYLCLPDEEKSWIAGSFDVTLQ